MDESKRKTYFDLRNTEQSTLTMRHEKFESESNIELARGRDNGNKENVEKGDGKRDKRSQL